MGRGEDKDHRVLLLLTWCCKEPDTAYQLSTHIALAYIN